ncbi:CAMK family protein kinase [Tritrichomonas foetus]|uniref:CAMK family protein kinase n=1 Tax=Tritrichomonas foetus TaxID=1144522 RepID=A0A1J4KSW1_9EUKA|nr:CAMK family protein kinase [Tritrichomonas foetus]|eukprot:OHT14347.1 CAMK family protein kinase [Tritrichomonas foetus]
MVLCVLLFIFVLIKSSSKRNFVNKKERHFFYVNSSNISELICPNKIGPYQLRGTIGSGAFATCKLAYRGDVDIYYACKIIAKQRLDEMTDKTRFEQEIRILQEMRHPRIVQLYDLYKESLNYYILMEYCPNGELFSHIVSMKKLPETDVRTFFKHILSGILFIHQCQIAHRDLKPENILIDAEGHAKISDFGLAKYVGMEGMTKTSCGSPCYVSPEILTGRPYNALKSDMWSAGVILYAMVTGQMPWTRRNQAQLFQQIKKCHYTIPQYVSQNCGGLIRGLININPDARLTAEQAINHSFMVDSIENIIEWKEVPIVSLRRLDRFFEVEPSDDNIKLPYRSASFGKRRKTFQKVLKLIKAKSDDDSNQSILQNSTEMMVKPSVTTWVKPSIREVPQQETFINPQQGAVGMNWKNVVKQANKKGVKGKKTIVKPKLSRKSTPLTVL